MPTATALSVFAFLLISYVLQTKAQSGVISVNLMDQNVNEDAGQVVFELLRRQGSDGSVTVNYTITDITTEPEDIVSNRSGSVTFLDGVTQMFVRVIINDDMLQEDTEQFAFTLVSGAVGPVALATALIFDNDIFSSWAEWSADVGPCSVTCGPGTRTETRTRTCIAVNTQRCSEPLSENRTAACNPGACPIITQWSEWADDGTCSTTCGSGSQMQSRTRTCTANCPVEFTSMETRTVACMICTCPVISQWTEWANDGACSTTCGPGTNTQTRTRTCTQSDCCPATLSLRETRTVSCELCTCPVIGSWNQWADSGQCSKTCGGGTKLQVRTRECTNTCTPSDCVKREERTVNCNVHACITTWSKWSGGWTGNRGSWGWSGGWSGGWSRNRWSRGSTWGRRSGSVWGR